MLQNMSAKGILGGYDLGQIDENLSDCMLTNTTETKTDVDLELFVDVLKEALAEC